MIKEYGFALMISDEENGLVLISDEENGFYQCTFIKGEYTQSIKIPVEKFIKRPGAECWCIKFDDIFEGLMTSDSFDLELDPDLYEKLKNKTDIFVKAYDR